MKFLKAGIVLALAAAAIGLYLYNKPHKSMERAQVDIEIGADQLFSEFQTNEATANEKFLDKIVAVTGEIREVTRGDDGNLSVILETGDMMSGITCQLDDLSTPKRTDFKVGETVTFKGVCTGFLMDVILVRCVEV